MSNQDEDILDRAKEAFDDVFDGGNLRSALAHVLETMQPRGEGMVLDAARYRLLRALPSHTAEIAVGSIEGEGPCILQRYALDAALDAMLDAAPGEESGRYPCKRGDKCKGRDCPDCANFTTPPASQSAEPHCAVRGRFDIDCLDCSDALERQRKAASHSAPSETKS